MLNLPPIMISLLKPFAPCFHSATTWKKAQVLLVGAILTPGKRVVTEMLRVMGLSESRQFAQYHQVLNRALWSALDKPDAADPYSLGVAGVGTAGDDGVVAFGTLLPTAQTSAQNLGGSQSANVEAAAPLVAPI